VGHFQGLSSKLMLLNSKKFNNFKDRENPAVASEE